MERLGVHSGAATRRARAAAHRGRGGGRALGCTVLAVAWGLASCGDNTSSDRAAGGLIPMADPGASRAVVVADIGDDTWEVYAGGLVEVAPEPGETERCLMLVGTITPLTTGGDPLASWTSTPAVLLEADGELLEPYGVGCDDDAPRRAGYQDLDDASALVGTSIPFAAVWQVGDQDPSAVVVGDPDGPDTARFRPDVVPAIPPLPELTAGPLDVAVQPVGPSSQFEHRWLDDLGPTWQVQVLGAVDSGPSLDDGYPGRCISVVGTATPTELPRGDVADGHLPSIGLIAGGRLIPSTFVRCDTAALDEAGYDGTAFAQVPLGNTYRWYEQFIVPGDADAALDDLPLHAIVADISALDGPTYFEPTMLAAPPPVDPTANGELDEELLPLTPDAPASFEYRFVHGQTTWTGVVQGLVAMPDADVTCVAVVGTVMPTESINGTTIEWVEEIPISVVVGGRALLRSEGECSPDALHRAGFVATPGSPFDVGVAQPIHAAFRLHASTPSDVQAIVVGDPAWPGAVYVEPLVLETVPNPIDVP